MLDKVRSALRIKSNVYDDEIQDVIDACKRDLQTVGVMVQEGDGITDNDPLIKRAIILYAKAHFGYQDDAQRYLETYQNLKCVLALSGIYGAGDAG